MSGKESKASITFYAAECMEFINYGRLYEDLTLRQAVAAYRKIIKRGTCGGPGIGFVLNDDRIPDYSDAHWPLFHNGEIARSDVNMIPAYREHSLVKSALQEIEKYLPQLEGNGKRKNRPRDKER